MSRTPPAVMRHFGLCDGRNVWCLFGNEPLWECWIRLEHIVIEIGKMIGLNVATTPYWRRE